jgi:hypothetical protein
MTKINQSCYVVLNGHDKMLIEAHFNLGPPTDAGQSSEGGPPTNASLLPAHHTSPRPEVVPPPSSARPQHGASTPPVLPAAPPLPRSVFRDSPAGAWEINQILSGSCAGAGARVASTE